MSAQQATSENSHISSATMRIWRNLRNLAWASGPKLEEIAGELSAIAESIPAVSKDIGVRYLHSSGVLDPLTQGSEALTAQSEELLKLAIGQTDGDLVVNGTTELLAGPFAFLENWRTGVQGYVSDLASCEEIFARLEHSQISLNALVSPLKHIQTMFRIEAARLPEETRQVFAGLTDQIAAVHNEVNETFAGQFQIVSQTLKTLAEVRQKISQYADMLQQGVIDRRRRVADSMEKLRHELARNGEREIELTQTSNAIAHSTTNVVIALQAHDICSQRLEHVSIALADICRILLGISDGTEQTKGALQQAWCLLMVQAAQVEDIYKHFETSERSLQTAVHEISSKVLAFDDECILLEEFQEVTVATNGSVELSLEMMQEIATLLRGVIRSSRDFCETIQPVRQMTARLTDALESLSNKMRLIALNAQVQAVHIGTGTGLEVLAAQTASVSTETSKNAEKVSTDIQSLIRVVGDLTASLQDITAQGESALGSFEGQSESHQTTLHGLRDRTLQQLTLVGQAVDQIGACTNGLREDSQARQTAVAPLDELAGRLRGIASQMKLRMSTVDQEAAFALQTNYKMQSERQIHKGVLAGLGMIEAGNTGVPVDAAPGEPADTSIELF